MQYATHLVQATKCTLANATGVRLEFIEEGSNGVEGYKPPPTLEPGEVASFLVDTTSFELKYNIQAFQGPSRGWVRGEDLDPASVAVIVGSASTAPGVINSFVQVVEPGGERPVQYATNITFVVSLRNDDLWKVNVEQSISTYVKGIKSIANSDGSPPPLGFLPEDTNKGFGGDFVYCAPILTDFVEACTGFELRVTDKPIDNLPQFSTGDLASGAGGEYRYIIPVNNPGGKKVRSIFWSEDSAVGDLGAEQRTGDINGKRGGRFLYLFWRYD